MFEDFDKKASTEGRGRRGVSVVLSMGIFGGLALLVGGAITAHQVHKSRVEREQKVTFADLPAIQAPKPKALVRAKAPKRAAARRKTVADVKQIPTERPEEAEGQLAMADDVGVIEGIIEKRAAPPPPPPPPKPEPTAPAAAQQRESIQAPRFVAGCRAPAVPNGLISTAATIRIDVEMMVDAKGRVVSARVVQSSPLVPDELVLSCAREQVFEPAQLPDGTSVPYPFRRRFVFKPSQA